VEEVVLFCDGVKPGKEFVSDVWVNHVVQCDISQDLPGLTDGDIRVHIGDVKGGKSGGGCEGGL